MLPQRLRHGLSSEPWVPGMPGHWAWWACQACRLRGWLLRAEWLRVPNVSAGGLGFLCPRSPGPWGACVLSRAAAWSCSWLHTPGLGLSRQQKRPVFRTGGWCGAHLPAAFSSVSRPHGLVWPTGLGYGLDLCLGSDLFPGQKEGLSWWWGPRQCGIRAVVVRKQVASLSPRAMSPLGASCSVPTSEGNTPGGCGRQAPAVLEVSVGM